MYLYQSEPDNVPAPSILDAVYFLELRISDKYPVLDHAGGKCNLRERSTEKMPKPVMNFALKRKIKKKTGSGNAGINTSK